MDKIAVLIPCYNEEQTIAKVVREAKEALPEAVVYVYDNNSTDRTVELAKAQGDGTSRRLFGRGDYIELLLNRYCRQRNLY